MSRPDNERDAGVRYPDIPPRVAGLRVLRPSCTSSPSDFVVQNRRALPGAQTRRPAAPHPRERRRRRPRMEPGARQTGPQPAARPATPLPSRPPARPPAKPGPAHRQFDTNQQRPLYLCSYHRCAPAAPTMRAGRTRGCSAARTIGRREGVHHGKRHFVFPNHEKADALLNSALAYELAAQENLPSTITAVIHTAGVHHESGNLYPRKDPMKTGRLRL